VVTLRCLDVKDKVVRIGSGFLAHGGRVVTNAHVVRGCNRIDVHNADGELLLTTPFADAYSNGVDVAVLPAISTPPHTLELSQSSPVVGQRIVVIGAPEGLSQTVSDGLVSALRNTDNGPLLQFTAPVSPGSSGGPILNLRGQVIGIVAAFAKEGQNLNFGVPANAVFAILNSPSAQVALLGIPLPSQDSAPSTQTEAAPPGSRFKRIVTLSGAGSRKAILLMVQVRHELQKAGVSAVPSSGRWNSVEDAVIDMCTRGADQPTEGVLIVTDKHLVLYDCQSSKAAYDAVRGSPDGGQSLEEMVAKLITYLKGWKPAQ
jgi:hypothetical protein